jgi:hypothetical protein
MSLGLLSSVGAWLIVPSAIDSRPTAETKSGSSLASLSGVPTASGSASASENSLSRPTWLDLTATSADAFVDTVGVNIHTGYTDTAYGQRGRTLSLLKRLGVRHVRDGLRPGDRETTKALRELHENGIDSTLIAGGSFEDFPESFEAGIDELSDPNKLGGIVSAVEGTNEPECDGWRDDITSRQRSLAAAMRAEPKLKDVPLLTPGWCRGVESIEKYGRDGKNSDVWNLHAYPGEFMPEADSPESKRDIASGRRGIDFTVKGQVAAARKIEDQPVWVTETGYDNALNNRNEGATPKSERAVGQYLPRIFLENFRQGVDRTFSYELLDEKSDPKLTDGEQAFGLVRFDGTPKPAYIALQSLLTTLTDRGELVADRRIRVGFANAPADFQQLAFARRDGSVDLVMWRAASVWDTKTRKDRTVPRATVVISTPAPVAGSLVRLDAGTKPADLGSARAFTISVGASPVILRLGSAS